jgi:hypothetical protein
MMLVARFAKITPGAALGSVSAILTYHLVNLLAMDPNLMLRVLKTVGLALVIPGLIAALASGDLYAVPLWAQAGVNFLFWFGFSWLFATFVSKFIKLRRAIAAVGDPTDRSSSLGSG